MPKIQVSIVKSSEIQSQMEVSVKLSDTIKKVKEHLVNVQRVTFPVSLEFSGTVLLNEHTVEEVGIIEGSNLDFIILENVDAIIDRLRELLKSRDLTVDELGLLYCYKHGVSINQDLKTVGIDIKFLNFLEQHASFDMDCGKVSLVSEKVLQPLNAVEELVHFLKTEGPMEITSLCTKFLRKFNTSLSSVVKMRPIDYLEAEPVFELQGRGMVGLRGSPSRAESFAQAMAQNEKARPKKVQQQPRQQRSRADIDEDRDDKLYQDLHTRVSSRAFNSRIAQTLTSIVDAIKEKSFLNIESVAKGGSVGNGTAIESCTDATVTFFCHGLPMSQRSKWIRPLVKSVRCILMETLPSDLVTDVREEVESVAMLVRNQVHLNLYFCPVIGTYDETVSSLASMTPIIRQQFNMMFAKERSCFIAKQPGSVKATIRLMKWWRDQQEWSSELTTPSNELLQAVCIYAASQKPKDLAQAISTTIALLARFDDMRIIWTNFYSKSDIWSPLLQQKPLLMDPVNPFVNLADPVQFDPREVVDKASITRFFY